MFSRFSIFIGAIIFSVNVFAAAPSDQLLEKIHAGMKKYHIVGASIAVVKDYKLLWAQGFGFANKETKRIVTPDTLFQAASISKAVSAVGAMQLFSQKDISLHANVDKYFKSWHFPKNNFTQETPVTLSLLLQHCAGVTGVRYKGYATNDTIPTLLQVLDGKAPANSEKVLVVRKPKTKTEYSPAGYTAVQQLMEDVAGKSFADVMQALVLSPCKMENSYFSQPIAENLLDRAALSYSPDGLLIPHSPAVFPELAAGGLWTTPTDLAKFLITLQKQKNHLADVPFDAVVIRHLLQPGFNHNWGAGMEVNMDKYGHEVKEGSGGYFLHSGFNTGYLSLMIGSVEGGNGVIIMINTAPDMSYKGDIVQFDFISEIEKAIVDEYDF